MADEVTHCYFRAARRDPGRRRESEYSNVPPDWAEIEAAICKRRMLGVRSIRSGWRGAEAVEARFELWWTLNVVHKVPLYVIGDILGGYDHSSVSHGVHEYQRRLDARPEQARAA